MLQRLQKELMEVREDLMLCFRETMPSKEFSTAMILGTVHLHLIVDRAIRTNNPEERRRLINEFHEGRDTIEKGIKILRQRSGLRQPRERKEIALALS